MRKVNAIIAGLAVMLIGGAAVAQTADVQIIHNSPDPAAASVDVYLDGALAVPGLAYRAATPVVALPAGSEIVVGIAPGGSAGPEDIIAEFPFTLTPGAAYVVMAAGVLDGGLPSNPEGRDTSFDLFAEALVTGAAAGEVNLLAFHGAPDAPTVDVRAVGVGTLIGALPFGEFAGYLPVPAADYTLQVTPAGDPGTVVASFSAPLTGLGGGAAVVFASGFLSGFKAGNDFGLFAALPSGEVLPLSPTTVSSEDLSWGSVKAVYR
jgi:hypothetical protein